jgi:hypothetical protein
MKGADVKHAQRFLADKDNCSKFGDFHPGATDGDFGEHSAGACHRARWFLGFPKDKCGRKYDAELDAYLTGKKRLNLWYRRRRRKRLAAALPPLRERAFKKAVSKLNVKESPAGSNRVFCSDWYGVCGPWCAMFVTWCYVQAGSKMFLRGSRYAYVPYLQNAIKHGYYGFREVHFSEAKRGDIVTFDWDRNGVPDHVGLFDRWANSSHSAFYTIEGNTALNNNSNGGQVMRRYRYVYQVGCFGRQEH